MWQQLTVAASGKKQHLYVIKTNNHHLLNAVNCMQNAEKKPRTSICCSKNGNWNSCGEEVRTVRASLFTPERCQIKSYTENMQFRTVFFFHRQKIKKKYRKFRRWIMPALAEEMRNDFWYVSFLFTALSLLVFSFRLRNLFSLAAIKCSLKIVIHHQERSTHNA